MATETPGARNDTRIQSRSAGAKSAAQDGASGECPARNAVPRVAGAAPTRGAQPSGRRVTICQFCRRRLMKMRNGAWYHIRGGSEFCHPGDGTRRKAVPLEIQAEGRPVPLSPEGARYCQHPTETTDTTKEN